MAPIDESGDPPDDYTHDYYSEMAEDMGITEDEVAMEALFVGWFDQDADMDERAEARDFFFDYLDLDTSDFDWDTWREFYGEAA